MIQLTVAKPLKMKREEDLSAIAKISNRCESMLSIFLTSAFE